MAYVKIQDNIVVQKQPNDQGGFVKVDNTIVCGMVHDGSGDYSKGTFSVPPLPAVTWDAIRSKRDRLLSACDWTQLADSPLNGNQAWVDYRQDLRDITSTYDSPDDVVWPAEPS